jgi:nudix-type nucleoside diphosphatase (YffH/AdpP family)
VFSITRLLDDFFKVDAAELSFELFDGSMSDRVRRLSFERGDSAAVLLAITDVDRMVLVNQFKFPTFGKGPGWILETVAGVIDQGEDPADCAAREAAEETGYVVRHIEPISTFYVSPGGSSERIFLYYAEALTTDRLSEGGGLASEHEDVQVVQLSPAEVFEMLDAGEIHDAKTIIAIQWLRQRSKAA